MPFEFHITFIDVMLKGMFIGMLASAPMGPVGVLCIQRTLNKGRWYGFITGVGAAFSDIIYALLTGLGMSFVMNLVQNEHNRFYLHISGSIILLLFGIYCWKSDPTKKIHISGHQKGSLWHNGITAFLVTLSNPLIILLFMASFAQLGFVIPDHPIEMTLGYLSIFAGALLWWYGLTWLVDKIRGIFNNEGIQLINKVIGSVVIIFSLVILFGTLFNLYTFSY